MKKTFSGYYHLTEQEFSVLWNDCKFVLDSNVILNMHRYSKGAHDDMLKILKAVSHRIWIPYQVAIEYQENRLNVIAEQARRFHDVKDVLTNIQDTLQGEFEARQMTKWYSSIKVDNFIKKVNRVFSEFKEELAVIERDQPDVTSGDKIRDEVDALFEGRVGVPPASQADLDRIYKEGQIRYERKQPPGYMDIQKAGAKEKDTYSYGGLLFQREYGDLILWNQIINQAKDNEEFRNIIFITDDDKEDWWWQVDSKGKKTIGPRPELVEEIQSKAGVSLFYMYNSERFMRQAEKHLGIKVERESITQVRDQSQLMSALRLGARRYRQRREAETELANVQTAVVAMMVDNRLIVLPHPVGIASTRTNDMGAFPDTSICGTDKLSDPVGNAYTAGRDKDGYILYRHDIFGDGAQTGLVNYVATQTTTYWYTVDASGTVTQYDTAP